MATAEQAVGPIVAEAARIEESAMYSAQTQFSSAKFWRGLNLALGVPAAVFAAVAGTVVLTELVSADVGAVIALAAAALTATMTTLDAAQRSEQSRIAANAFLALQGDARVLRTIDALVLDEGTARARLAELAERRNAISAAAPVPAYLAYRLGRHNIAKGRQSYSFPK